MGLASDRDERRQLMDAAAKKLADDPGLKEKLRAHVLKACKFALNGHAPKPALAPAAPDSQPPPTPPPVADGGV